MQSWKLDEKQKQIVIEQVVVQYFHEHEENYHELIVVEIQIDWFPGEKKIIINVIRNDWTEDWSYFV